MSSTAPTAPAPRSTRGGATAPPTRRAKSDHRVWLYALPVVAIFLFVFVGPLAYTAWVALHETSYFTVGEFSGLRAFADMFADPSLPGSIRTTLIFSFGTIVIALPAGLLSALVLNSLTKLKRTARSLLLLPWLMSQATAGTIWLWFLNPNFGPATVITERLGFGPTNYFSTPTAALVAVILITAWWSYPQAMLLLLGALQTIPMELRESLRVDGGGLWREFTSITLPYLRNSIVSVIIVLLMLYVQMVTIILVTTRGGPVGATETLSMRVFNQTFEKYDLSGAAATAILLFAINVVITMVAIKFRRKETL